MTCEEVYRKYINVYRVLMKAAGNETGNPVYKDIDNILNTGDNKAMIDKAIADEVEFNIFLTVLQFPVLVAVHGIDGLRNKEPSEIHQNLHEFYQLYLAKGTKDFCRKYGLPVFNDPEMTVLIRRLNKLNSL